MKKCLVIGAVFADTVLNVDHVPISGEDVVVTGSSVCAGGCAYNVACVLKEFDIPATLFAPIGKGIYADFLRQEIKKRGIEAVCHDKDYDNGNSICMIDKNAERTFINIMGVDSHYKSEWFDILNMSEYDTIYFPGYEMEGDNYSVIYPFIQKHKDVCRLYLAPGPACFRIPKPYMQQLLALSPVLHLNASEAIYISGETSYRDAADTLFRLTGSPVIITIGKEGCLVKTKSDSRFIEAEAVRAIDTNGAGDSHLGTIIATRKLNHDIFNAARVANHVASQVIQVNAPNLPPHTLSMR